MRNPQIQFTSCRLASLQRFGLANLRHRRITRILPFWCMRLLFTFLSFAEDVFGGIENSILNLAKGFELAGAHVAVYTSTLHSNATNVDGVRAIRSPVLLPSELPDGNAERDQALLEHFSTVRDRVAGEIETITADEDVTAIISCDPLWGIIHPCGVWRRAKRPIVLSFHVANSRDVLASVANAPYAFLRAVSAHLRQQLTYRYPLESVEVIPNSIDLARFRPPSNHSARERIFFCNSRIDRGKGVLFLLDAYRRLRRRHPDFQLWLCAGHSPFGDRSRELSLVQRFIRENGLQRHVRLLPNLRWSEVPTYLYHAFAVVLPTLNESFGRAALESLATGTPLLAAASGNLPDLVGNSGVLVEPASADALYAGMCRLIEEPELTDTLERWGPMAAAPYNNELVAQQFLATLRRHI